MVLNDFRHDFRVILANEDLTTLKVAEMANKAQSNVSRMTSGRVISECFETVLDAIGYDIKVEYIKRKD